MANDGDADAERMLAEAGAGSEPAEDDPPLNDGGKRALEAERKARREAERQARRAQERARELETAQVRSEVANEKGVPADLLNGSTREELIAHADRLLAFRNPEPDKPAASPLTRPREALRADPGDNNPPDDVEDIARRVFGT